MAYLTVEIPDDLGDKVVEVVQELTQLDCATDLNEILSHIVSEGVLAIDSAIHTRFLSP